MLVKLAELGDAVLELIGTLLGLALQLTGKTLLAGAYVTGAVLALKLFGII
jgi:hypothetical protein